MILSSPENIPEHRTLRRMVELEEKKSEIFGDVYAMLLIFMTKVSEI
jgi:hypothetical protein